jgi:hypothetical protein
MRNVYCFLIMTAVSLALVGCGGGEKPNTASNAGNTNTTAPNTNGTDPLAITTPTPKATTNNAPTLTPVFKAYCDAMNRKDEAAVRKIYSTDTMKNIEEQMKMNKITKLFDYLDDSYAKTCEVRNEQINGDTAVAEIRGDSYPNGLEIVFVKENGQWKLTTRSPAIENMKPAAK